MAGVAAVRAVRAAAGMFHTLQYQACWAEAHPTGQLTGWPVDEAAARVICLTCRNSIAASSGM
eukprot:scaffold2864_cov52-Phaeocystis_antarctica.AAC.5